MGKDSEFYKGKKKAQTIRLRELLIQLPPCAVDYIHSKEVTSQVSTLVQYSYDLITFFTFMKDQNPVFRNIDPKEISVDLISKISPEDILEYQRYLELNVDRNHYHENGKKAIARKMSPLRGMFKFLLVYKKIKENPMELVPLPRLKKDKNIIRMNAAEVQSMMNTAEYGAGTMSDRQRKFAEKTKFRDVLNANTLTIVRKGGAQDLLYFGDPVHDAISDYLELERKGIQVREGHEKAMFLSLQGKRISVDAIENLVKKYAKIAVPNKIITPHKLRSTYGTALYRETGDIRLVADVLGHENINTTIDYYAAIEDEHKRQARNAVDYKKMNKDQ